MDAAKIEKWLFNWLDKECGLSFAAHIESKLSNDLKLFLSAAAPSETAERAAPNVDDVPDLYQLAYAPGVFRCPKCDFQLSKQTLNMQMNEIGTTPENRQSEECPNDGTMMVHVTYKEMVVGYDKRLKQELDETDRLRAALAAAALPDEREAIRLAEAEWWHPRMHVHWSGSLRIGGDESRDLDCCQRIAALKQVRPEVADLSPSSRRIGGEKEKT